MAKRLRREGSERRELPPQLTTLQIACNQVRMTPDKCT
jgi:hypothetical protein